MRTKPYDLALLNGTIFDAVTGTLQTDIGIIDGKIAALGKLSRQDAQTVVNATGCIITPGLIDYHCHVNNGGDWASLPPEVYGPQNGITTMVDAGSAGCGGYELFHRGVALQSLLDIKAFLFIGSAGQVGLGGIEDENPKQINKDLICSLCEKYKDEIVGIKLKIDKAHCEAYGMEPLKAAIRLGEATGLRVSVHVTDPAVPVSDILNALRPGDIFCHMYHNTGEGILQEDGCVSSEVRKARQRGILFDAAHGKTLNFSLKVAQKAIEQNFLPDIISSDYTKISLNARYSFTFMLSEYLQLGMTFEQIIERCTTIPHKLLYGKREALIDVSKPADLAVFKIDQTAVTFWDYYGDTLAGERLIQNLMTIKNGLLIFDQLNDKNTLDCK